MADSPPTHGPRPRHGLYALYHFSLWGAAGLWWPFVFPLLAARGVPFARLGLLVAVWPVCALIAQPLAGWLCDRTHRARLVQSLLTFAVAGVLPFFGVAQGFRGELAVSVAFAFLNAPVGPLGDALTVAYLHQAGGDYGRLRLWGSLSFAVAGLAGGWALAHGLLSTPAIFRLAALLTLPSAVLPLAFPVEIQPRKHTRPSLRDLRAARPLLWFLAICAINIVPMNAHSTYFSLYLARLGGTPAHQGAGWSLPAFAEVPFFLWGAGARDRLGMRRTLILAFGCLAASLVGIAAAPGPGLAVAAAVLQGPAFALFYGAAVPAVDGLAPDGWRASGQSLLWAACFGAGSVVANLGAGWAAAALGVKGLYRVLAAASLVAAAVCATVAGRTVPDDPGRGAAP